MNRNNIRQALIMLIILMGALRSDAQEERFKSIFIYNFTKYINWPPKPGNFIIAVYDQNMIFNELSAIASKKTMGAQPIEVKKVNSLAEIKGGHILFLGANKSHQTKEIAELCKLHNMLLVTEKPESCASGACINFILRDGRLTFEISRNNILSKGIDVSLDLISMGINFD